MVETPSMTTPETKTFKTPEHVREYNRRYRIAHREELVKYQRKYRASHVEQIRKWDRESAKRHYERTKEKLRELEALKLELVSLRKT